MAVVALGGFVVFAGLTARFIVLPPRDALPAHADVIVVLGPANWHRTAMARELVQRGVSDTVLISIPLAARTPGSWDYRRFHDCAKQAGATTYCDYAEPHTTRGEARMLARYAAEHGWRSAVVITQTAHLERSRLIVGRCFAGTITMHRSNEGPENGWPYQIAYQTAATVKAWLSPGC